MRSPLRRNSNREEYDEQSQIEALRNLENSSTVLIDIGVQVVKRNPIKTSLYVLGILLCFFFNGFAIPPEKNLMFEEKLAQLDHDSLAMSAAAADAAHRNYYHSKGWFSCDATCTRYKQIFDEKTAEYNLQKQKMSSQISSAKSEVGVFSEFGVAEARRLFWERFGQGKEFALRQTKWNALFMGIGAMSRDEHILSYILRVLMSLVTNLTIGVCGAALVFIFGLYGLVQSFQPSTAEAVTFFVFASLAALSFALTWLIVLYTAAAGTVYVGARVLASNLRQQRLRASADPQYYRRVRD